MEVKTLSTDEDHQVLGDDYCSGYTDQYGKWNTGFYCPTKSNDEAVYCCGSQTYKYCCTRRQVIHTNNTHPTRTQLDPRILLKIVGLTCIVSVFLTILTCYVCKRYWKRSESPDNHVYRVACTTSTTPHVFPLESFQPLHPNAFLKSPEHSVNFCGDLPVIPGHHPTQYRFISRPLTSASSLCSYQHSSFVRQQRNHEPPPPYQLNVISGNSVSTNGNGNGNGNRNSNNNNINRNLVTNAITTSSQTNDNSNNCQTTDPKSLEHNCPTTDLKSSEHYCQTTDPKSSEHYYPTTDPKSSEHYCPTTDPKSLEASITNVKTLQTHNSPKNSSTYTPIRTIWRRLSQ